MSNTFVIPLPTTMSLNQFYETKYQYFKTPDITDNGITKDKYGTPFTRIFLGGANLEKVRNMLTHNVRYESGLPKAAPIAYSEAFLKAMMDWATIYCAAAPTQEAVDFVNQSFVDQYSSPQTWTANMSNFFHRWCTDAIPDPNNVPLPIWADHEERNPDPSAYMLSHPYGSLLPRI